MTPAALVRHRNGRPFSSAGLRRSSTEYSAQHSDAASSHRSAPRKCTPSTAAGSPRARMATIPNSDNAIAIHCRGLIGSRANTQAQSAIVSGMLLVMSAPLMALLCCTPR